jgi:quercetin dioxygenase-like cupin family protein
MSVILASQASVHQLHGATFTSYVRPSAGSTELCAWRIEIPADTRGASHQVSREEVIYVLSGSLSVSVDDELAKAAAGDAIVVPAGSHLRVDNLGTETVTGWVTTSAGFFGILADGSTITPPWTR